MEDLKMNQHNYEKMVTLRFQGMVKAYEEQNKLENVTEWSFEERLAHLLDSEFDSRKNSKIERLVKQANFSDSNARLEDIQYLSDRHLTKDVFQKLSTNKYLDEHKNIIFVGATGSGKSYLACALGKNACLSGIRVNYIRLPDLLTDLELARVEGRYPKVVKQYQKIDLLIIDEFLLFPTPQQAQQDILEVLERRYRLHSTIFCSQFKVDGWHE